MNALDAVLRNDRWIVLGALGAMTAGAWAYLWDGAGMGMPAADMTAAILFPHRQPHVGGSMEASLVVIAFMWWAMMVAMMTPAAAPLLLLHARVLNRHGHAALMPTLLLLAGYLLVWLLFSLAAAGLQGVLEAAGWISAMMLWSRSALLSSLVLAAAGLYQLTRLKHACLSHCRAPASFLVNHWRPGAWGAFLLGLRHGAFCVGCCWLLMALLFIGGVMNLVWIAALTAIVLAERLLPFGERSSRVLGCLLLGWALATLFV